MEFEIEFARDGDYPGLDNHVHIRCSAAWEPRDASWRQGERFAVLSLLLLENVLERSRQPGQGLGPRRVSCAMHCRRLAGSSCLIVRQVLIELSRELLHIRRHQLPLDLDVVLLRGDAEMRADLLYKLEDGRNLLLCQHVDLQVQVCTMIRQTRHAVLTD
jgi:hypothetical protein